MAKTGFALAATLTASAVRGQNASPDSFGLPPPPPPNQTYVINFGGTVDEVWGSPEIGDGTNIIGSIIINPSDFVADGEYGGPGGPSENIYYDPNAIISYPMNGTNSVFQGILAYSLYDLNDAYGNLSDSFELSWGPNDDDAVGVSFHTYVVPNSLTNSLWYMMENVTNSNFTLPNDSFFGVGWGGNGSYGANGGLSNWTVEPFVPPTLSISYSTVNNPPGADCNPLGTAWPTNVQPAYNPLGSPVTLSWPTNIQSAYTFQPQTTSSLLGTIEWLPIPNAPAPTLSNDGTNYLTFFTTNLSSYYRLVSMPIVTNN